MRKFALGVDLCVKTWAQQVGWKLAVREAWGLNAGGIRAPIGSSGCDDKEDSSAVGRRADGNLKDEQETKVEDVGEDGRSKGRKRKMEEDNVVKSGCRNNTATHVTGRSKALHSFFTVFRTLPVENGKGVWVPKKLWLRGINAFDAMHPADEALNDADNNADGDKEIHRLGRNNKRRKRVHFAVGTKKDDIG